MSSASFISSTTAYASHTSGSTKSGSVSSTSTISSLTSSSSENSAFPTSATLSAPTESTSQITSTQGSSSLSISRGAIIGIAVVPVFLVIALLVLWRYYRQQKNSLKEAMLIAPRTSSFDHLR